MEPTIELKLISCNNLQAFNFFQKLTLYALTSIDTTNPSTTQLSDQQKQQQRTQTHRDPENGDGTNPEWNHEARFHLRWVPLSSLLDGSRNDLFFRFEFRHDGVILGDKVVGECRVPVLDLVRDAVGGDVARFVSYEVRNGDGKPNGIFNFSYRVKGIGTHSSQSQSQSQSQFQFLEDRISGYTVVDSNELRVQYPTLEIEKPCCYPPVECCSPSAPLLPPLNSSPSYNYYYPPPLQSPYPYPPPPPPPVPPPAMQYYPPFGPQAHPWPSGFEHRW